MTNYTEDQIEEANHEMWVMGGGRERSAVIHADLARATFAELSNNGWRVIEQTDYKDSGDEFRKLEIVVRKDREVKILHWNSFNKGWMESSQSGGWSIFYIDGVSPRDRIAMQRALDHK